MVQEIREQQPKIGTRKLHHKLKPEVNQLGFNIGRDKLFDILSENKLLIRKRKTRVRTTNSNHIFKKYPNLVKEFIPYKSNQLWVSDITYIRTLKGFVYVYFLTDAYSHKIVGFEVSGNLEAINAVKCLRKALKQMHKPITGLIHHSDRGIQYCSHEYVNLLQDYKIRISMTENGDPRENAIAERINGIIKDEFLSNVTMISLSDAKERIESVILIYNKERPHMSCDMLTPDDAHKQSGILKKHWKKYYLKNNNLINDNLTNFNVKPVNLF